MSISPKDVLLAFISAQGDRFPTDRIRIMKGLFLLSKGPVAEFHDLYDFRPYSYGPFSGEIYSDLESLLRAGLISATVKENGQIEYAATQRGATQAREVMLTLSQPVANALREIKQLVTRLGFLPLLRHVYSQYPEYATRSVIRR